jgi:alkane 1-monooxygenase
MAQPALGRNASRAHHRLIKPAAAGTLARTLGATSPWWFALVLVLVLVLFYGVIPLAYWLIGEDLTNPPEAEVSALESDGYYR